jgi:hypothetical protein
MDITAWVPWLLAAGNVSSAFCTGKGLNAGWVLLVLTQMAFILYAVITGQPGFLLQNVAMIAIGVYNFVKWRKRRKGNKDGRLE